MLALSPAPVEPSQPTTHLILASHHQHQHQHHQAASPTHPHHLAPLRRLLSLHPPPPLPTTDIDTTPSRAWVALLCAATPCSVLYDHGLSLPHAPRRRARRQANFSLFAWGVPSSGSLLRARSPFLSWLALVHCLKREAFLVEPPSRSSDTLDLDLLHPSFIQRRRICSSIPSFFFLLPFSSASTSLGPRLIANAQQPPSTLSPPIRFITGSVPEPQTQRWTPPRRLPEGPNNACNSPFFTTLRPKSHILDTPQTPTFRDR